MCSVGGQEQEAFAVVTRAIDSDVPDEHVHDLARAGDGAVVVGLAHPFLEQLAAVLVDDDSCRS